MARPPSVGSVKREWLSRYTTEALFTVQFRVVLKLRFSSGKLKLSTRNSNCHQGSKSGWRDRLSCLKTGTSTI